MSLADHQQGDGQSPSRTVVAAIADHEGVEPTDIVSTLYEVIDPEALDALFESRGSETSRCDGSVTFDYCGYEVTVEADGRVHIDGAAVTPESAPCADGDSPNAES